MPGTGPHPSLGAASNRTVRNVCPKAGVILDTCTQLRRPNRLPSRQFGTVAEGKQAAARWVGSGRDGKREGEREPMAQRFFLSVWPALSPMLCALPTKILWYLCAGIPFFLLGRLCSMEESIGVRNLLWRILAIRSRPSPSRGLRTTTRMSKENRFSVRTIFRQSSRISLRFVAELVGCN